MIDLKNIKNQKYSDIKLVEILFCTFPISFIIGNLILSSHLLLFIIVSLISINFCLKIIICSFITIKKFITNYKKLLLLKL